MAKPQRLGPYRIGKPLGKGGMGTVYGAINEETQERVAVKTLSPELAVAEGFRERFEAEIESLRTLRHPNIVRLFGYGEEDGLLFYAMEYVEGASLEEELRNARPFEWREVTRIAIQVSRALKHAHDHGIIHRDIKPANILLSDERAMLADFGIAQLFGGAKLTTARGVVGTADFMSPEQAESRPITDRCDQYSLGCVMYALLAGRPPFRAKSLPEMLQLQRYADPEPVRRFAPDTPKQLEKVIMQLLEKSPRDRFPSAMALAKHLEAMLLALSRPAALQSDFSLKPETDAGLKAADPGVTPPDPRAAAQPENLEYETLALATEGPGDLSVVAPPNEAQGTPEPTRRFTVVHDEPVGADADARPAWQVAAQGAIALAIVAAVTYGVVLLLRPPDADELYARIAAAAEAQDESILDVADEIEDFLERFPGDPRTAEVGGLRDDVELFEAESRLMGMLRRRADAHSIGTPIEALYVDAMRDAKHNPDEAVAQLRALTRLLAVAPNEKGPEDGDEQTAAHIILRLAEQQIERLEKRVAQRAAAQLPFLKERLAHARRLRETDPAAAAAVCHSIIEIYGQRDWAAKQVAEARALVSTIEGER